MNITWNKVLWFALGAAVGVGVSYNYFKTKYERIAQEEIDSVKRAFSEPSCTAEQIEDDIEDETLASVAVTHYANIIRQQEYASEDGPVEPIGEEVTGVKRPYVISPEDFDTLDDYECQSLNYYADGVLADDMGNVVEDIDGMVGRDSLNHFGEYEDDAVHVRNDALQCDFEILRDLDNYSDVYQSGQRPDDD